MLTIRLQRVGRKHEPVFRLVLTDSKNSPKSGKFLEILGNYDARRGDQAQFNAEKVKVWGDNQRVGLRKVKEKRPTP
jgi:small subunit ribosomal protein S16